MPNVPSSSAKDKAEWEKFQRAMEGKDSQESGYVFCKSYGDDIWLLFGWVVFMVDYFCSELRTKVAEKVAEPVAKQVAKQVRF